MPEVRLYVEHPLGEGQTVPLERPQAHYLFSVMRLGPGATVTLFNGRDGAWAAEVTEAGKRGGALTCTARTAPQRDPPDIWLIFAPLKKTRTDFVIEKAVELGVSRLCPVQTAYTNAERIRRDRLQATAVEAAEQCGATAVPEVADLVRLDRLLADWPSDRALILCDEALAGERAPSDLPPAPAAILIGPEGGLSDEERRRAAALSGARAISLGPRILRAETAALAALTLWQSLAGDWR